MLTNMVAENARGRCYSCKLIFEDTQKDTTKDFWRKEYKYLDNKNCELYFKS